MILRFDIEQGSDDWFAIKSGKFSASVADDLLMGDKTAGFNNLIYRIVEERFTGVKTESKSYSNSYMERGISMEEEAVSNYELKHFATTKKIGVIEVDDWTVVSPDRLIDDDGLLQIKCPIFKTQVEYLKSNNKVPSAYYKQMQFELWASEREYNVFYSYHPSLPSVEILVRRDESMIKQIAERIDYAKGLIVKEIEFLNNLMLNDSN